MSTPPTTAAAREPDAWRTLADCEWDEDGDPERKWCNIAAEHGDHERLDEYLLTDPWARAYRRDVTILIENCERLSAALRAAAERVERLEAAGQRMADAWVEYRDDRWSSDYMEIAYEAWRAALAVARDGAGA